MKRDSPAELTRTVGRPRPERTSPSAPSIEARSVTSTSEAARVRADRFRRLLCRARLQVEDRDARAVGGEPPADRLADPGAAAGDDRGAPAHWIGSSPASVVRCISRPERWSKAQDPVEHAPVVPHDHVPDRPAVRVHAIRPGGALEQLVEQRPALLRVHPDHPVRRGADHERAPARSVRPHERVLLAAPPLPVRERLRRRVRVRRALRGRERVEDAERPVPLLLLVGEGRRRRRRCWRTASRRPGRRSPAR